jgi:hypothetical protein
MKLISKWTSYPLYIAAALIALLVAIVPSASAKQPATKNSDQPAKVIAHVPLQGAPADQMLLQNRDGKQFLYLVRNSNKGFTVLDVTKPSRPKLIKRVVWPDGANAGSLQLVGNSVGLAEGTDVHTAYGRAAAAPENIELLDLTDPSNPKTVKSFSGVTSVLTDQGRDLVYLTNPEGLWIVKSRPERFVTHSCSSEDAINPMPSCK